MQRQSERVHVSYSDLPYLFSPIFLTFCSIFEAMRPFNGIRTRLWSFFAWIVLSFRSSHSPCQTCKCFESLLSRLAFHDVADHQISGLDEISCCMAARIRHLPNACQLSSEQDYRFRLRMSAASGPARPPTWYRTCNRCLLAPEYGRLSQKRKVPYKMLLYSDRNKEIWTQSQ
jgi:hypothetical protein